MSRSCADAIELLGTVLTQYGIPYKDKEDGGESLVIAAAGALSDRKYLIGQMRRIMKDADWMVANVAYGGHRGEDILCRADRTLRRVVKPTKCAQ